MRRPPSKAFSSIGLSSSCELFGHRSQLTPTEQSGRGAVGTQSSPQRRRESDSLGVDL